MKEWKRDLLLTMGGIAFIVFLILIMRAMALPVVGCLTTEQEDLLKNMTTDPALYLTVFQMLCDRDTALNASNIGTRLLLNDTQEELLEAQLELLRLRGQIIAINQTLDLIDIFANATAETIALLTEFDISVVDELNNTRLLLNNTIEVNTALREILELLNGTTADGDLQGIAGRLNEVERRTDVMKNLIDDTRAQLALRNSTAAALPANYTQQPAIIYQQPDNTMAYALGGAAVAIVAGAVYISSRRRQVFIREQQRPVKIVEEHVSLQDDERDFDELAIGQNKNIAGHLERRKERAKERTRNMGKRFKDAMRKADKGGLIDENER